MADDVGTSAARAAAEEALALARRHGGTAREWREVLVSVNGLGDVERAEGDLPAARATHAEALELARRLADQLDSSEARRDLWVSLVKLGGAERAEGDLGAARKARQEALGLARSLADQLGTTDAQRDLSAALAGMGNVEQAEGNLDAARAAHRGSIKIARQVAGQGEDPQLLEHLSARLVDLGDVEQVGGNVRAAMYAYHEALGLDRRLAEELRTPSALRHQLVSQTRLGDLAWDEGNVVAARNQYDEAVTLAHRLAEQQGTLAELTDLSTCLMKLGLAWSGASLADARQASYRRTVELARRLARHLGAPEVLEKLSPVLSTLDPAGSAGPALWAPGTTAARRVEILAAGVDALVDATVAPLVRGDVRRLLARARYAQHILVLSVHDAQGELRVLVPDRADLAPARLAEAIATLSTLRQRFPWAAVRLASFDDSSAFASRRVSGVVTEPVILEIHVDRTFLIATAHHSAVEAARPSRLMQVVAHECWHLVERTFETRRPRDSIQFRMAVGRLLGVATLEHAYRPARPGDEAALGRLRHAVGDYATTKLGEGTAELFMHSWLKMSTDPIVTGFGNLVDTYLPAQW